MRALSAVKADRLYWLGRYAQRALTGDQGQLAFNVARAYENGFLLRDLIDTDVFASLRLAQTRTEGWVPGQFLEGKAIHDALWAFWGRVDLALDLEAAALCRWGRWLEVWLEGTSPLVDVAWRELARAWGDLRLGLPPSPDPETVASWFEFCFRETEGE